MSFKLLDVIKRKKMLNKISIFNGMGNYGMIIGIEEKEKEDDDYEWGRYKIIWLNEDGERCQIKYNSIDFINYFYELLED